MKTKSENYYEGDNIIEGAVLNTLFGMPSAAEIGQALASLAGEGSDTVEHVGLHPTADELDIAMLNVIVKCRSLGLTEDEIRDSIRLNLSVYQYAADTFPIDRWMGDKEKQNGL